MKVLTTELDGADAATHRSRMQRTQELVQAQDRELAFLWRVRQQDFYGDTTPGGSMAIPSPEEIARALDIASEIIERIDSALHPQERPDPSNA